MTLDKKAMDPITSHTTEVVEPQKKGTTKQRADALDETTIRLCYAMEDLEEKVEMAKSEIPMTEAAAIILDLQDEMEALRAQLRYFLAALIEDEARKEAIRSQFFPVNVKYQARRTLRDLKHTSSIREYVKSFSRHMLNIRAMSEKNKLFTFMGGLKPWTRTELQREKVTDLSTAMGASKCLSDYQTESKKDRPSGSNQGNYHNSRQGNFNGSNSNNWNKGKATEGRTDATPKLKCFLCDGPHRVSECPQKRMVNAYCQLASGGSSSKQEASQANCHNETDSEEDEDVVGAFSHRCNTLSYRVAEKDDVPLKEIKMEEAKARIYRAKGLMYIDVKINGKPIRAIAGTGATHNYLACTEVERLGLVLEKGSGKVKAINSTAQPIAGVAKSMLIKVGPFEGRTNLSVGRMGEKSISVMQFSKGFKRNEPFFLCTLRLEEIKEANGPIPKPVKRLIREFEDIMPEELPKKLPPRRTIDHEIELIPGAKPLARAPYRMSQLELEELRKQLGKMLESGIIVLAKSLYEAPVLFQKKANGSFRICCDYRTLNKITVKNSYHIPLVADCFDRLNDFVVVYLDDIVLYSETLEEHVQHVRQVFNRLRENELYAKPSKCSFVQTSISFLGHIIE
ncbi:uncharacterized protein LOC111412751 [Olea europaea var. sylvestris]|uniref:uncharacterized protein LOC111412751 n=1 Tax=Olea europaea var. sylvestris TaxID=158386 RepID=UPI000C1D6830|nr:uncharacterized protein LOC111412751 [Olea europaea var. sylvestris]